MCIIKSIFTRIKATNIISMCIKIILTTHICCAGSILRRGRPQHVAGLFVRQRLGRRVQPCNGTLETLQSYVNA